MPSHLERYRKSVRMAYRVRSRQSSFTYPHSPQSSIRFVGDNVQTFHNIYRSQPWVFIAANKIARSLANVSLKAYEGRESDRRPSSKTLLTRLLEQPAPSVDPFRLIARNMLNLCIYGNSISPIVRDPVTREIREMYPSSFRRWQIVPGVSQPVGMYIYRNSYGDPPKAFAPDQVIHYVWEDPDSDIAGMSPLIPLAKTLTIEDGAVRLAVDEFEYPGLRGGYLTTEQRFDETKVSDKLALARLEKMIEVMRGPEGANKMRLFEGGLELKSPVRSFDDVAVVPHRKLTQIEVAAAYDIPPPLIGILDNATYSNITTQREMLYSDTLASQIVSYEQKTNLQGIWTVPAWQDQFVEFDVRSRLRGSHLERMRAYQYQQWFVTPNEVRRIENLPEIKNDPEADRIHVPLNTTTEVSDPANAEASAQMRRHIDALSDGPYTEDGLRRWLAMAEEIAETPPVVRHLLAMLADDGDAGAILPLLGTAYGCGVEQW